MQILNMDAGRFVDKCRSTCRSSSKEISFHSLYLEYLVKYERVLVHYH